jgi:hypothetical protein
LLFCHEPIVRARNARQTSVFTKRSPQNYEDFETVQRLKMWLRGSLNTGSNGLVPNEVWDAAKDAHRAAYNEWIETAREAEAQGDGLTVEG